ncbi:hypothetical protein LX15_005441 [Streptoalloteichus tenebrarius]|uniref:DUF5667 domain-containing protein n=1 Tax=Streptoalloteichus tenebrarius (strain ATCC 17920 / DSM 40477 / JCM 4838 / CBS 697.72 / NBRC 16177 / NCIMB 11028 / NRRL B-12390 / A12253. 1 / ISP 5477) TaxID=1933 RepID=A0ABT1I1T8_STRSD|nr:DUF5667 domain-containing protein [Streptoalloteichus tenebrarius]MCP2261715.1 hypothetical protein [Streptoalloteichus tenebrarius]
MTTGRAPFGDRGRRGRFARATEALPTLTPPAHTRDRADQDRDGAPPPFDRLDDRLTSELAVVALLRRSADDLGPDPAARDRMRERLLAEIAARPPVEPQGPAPARGPRRRRGRRPPGRGRTARRPHTGPGADTDPAPEEPGARHGAHGRLAVALVAALCLVLSLSGMSLLLSRDALPGDPLYRVKRSAENASLGLTFGDESRAARHLELAASRMGEIEALAGRRHPPADDYLTALADFEEDAAAGSRLLAQLGGSGDAHSLEALRGWAEQQERRLSGSAAALPRAVATRAEATSALLTRIRDRAAALVGRAGCASVSTGAADDIGPLPATEPCVPVPARRDPPAPARPSGADIPASTAGPPSARPVGPDAEPPQPSVLAEPPAGTDQPERPAPDRPGRLDQPDQVSPTPGPRVLGPSPGGRSDHHRAPTTRTLPRPFATFPPFGPVLPGWHDR